MKQSLVLFVLLLLSLPIQAQQWPGYIPEKSRKDILKKAFRMSGIGAGLKTGSDAIIMWMTNNVAHAVVSNMIDKERLSNSEADERLSSIRKPDSYVLMCLTRTMTRGGIFGGPATVKQAVEPLDKSAIFIQRKDDIKIFTKAVVIDNDYDFWLAIPAITNSYILVFPRTSRENVAIADSLEDRLQVQLNLLSKKVLLDYKIKDLVTRLEDL